MGILAVMSFIVRMSDVIDGSEGVLLPVVGLDEGSAFDLARRPMPIIEPGEDEVGVTGGDNRLGIVLLWDICDDEDAPLPVDDMLVKSGDVEGETGALEVGVW